MKVFVGPVTLVVFGGFLLGCGEAHERRGGMSPVLAGQRAPRETSSKSGSIAPTVGGRIADAYDDDPLAPNEGGDDNQVVNYGHRADAKDRLAIRGIVTRYFRAASADDGVATCELFVRAQATKIVSEFGQNNPSYMRGHSCSEVIAKFYRHDHRMLSNEASGFRVTDVRVSARSAYALLAFTTTPERRYLSFEREHGVWRMANGIIDTIYP
jgi:hypothetical protein